MGVDWKIARRQTFEGLRDFYILMGLIFAVVIGVMFIVLITTTDEYFLTIVGIGISIIFIACLMAFGGILGAFTTTYYQYSFIKMLKTDIKTEDLHSTQKRAFEVDLDQESAIVLAEHIIKDLGKVDLKKNYNFSPILIPLRPSSKVTSIARNSVKGKFQQFGWYSNLYVWYIITVVEVEVVPKDSKTSIIDVTTHPLWRKYPFDYGSSMEAMMRFEKAMGAVDPGSFHTKRLKPSWLG